MVPGPPAVHNRAGFLESGSWALFCKIAIFAGFEHSFLVACLLLVALVPYTYGTTIRQIWYLGRQRSIIGRDSWKVGPGHFFEKSRFLKFLSTFGRVGSWIWSGALFGNYFSTFREHGRGS